MPGQAAARCQETAHVGLVVVAFGGQQVGDPGRVRRFDLQGHGYGALRDDHVDAFGQRAGQPEDVLVQRGAGLVQRVDDEDDFFAEGGAAGRPGQQVVQVVGAGGGGGQHPFRLELIGERQLRSEALEGRVDAFGAGRQLAEVVHVTSAA